MLDGLAFVRAQTDEGARPKGARVLLVGAGGAGSAIAIALLEAGVRELIIHDSNEARSAELLRILGDLGRGRASSGPPDPTGCDMVCNASPMGMEDGDPLPVAANLLSASIFVGDVIAGHGVTPFLKAAKAAGCKTSERRPDGRGGSGDDARLHAGKVAAATLRIITAEIVVVVRTERWGCDEITGRGAKGGVNRHRQRRQCLPGFVDKSEVK